MTTRQAAVIASGHSKDGRAAYEAVPAMLRERGIEVIEAHFEPTHKGLRKRIKRAMKAGIKLIVVCGGDGTLTHAVRHFAHKDCTLGIVPAGTGNSFAMGLGIQGSFEDAIDTIVDGTEARVDLGTINKTFFANFVTIGLPAEVAANTSRGLKHVVGAIAYGIAGIVPLVTHKPFRARFSWKKHEVRVETHQAIVANGRFYGHQPLAPDATLVDGRLTVFVRDTASKLDAAQTHLALLRGDQAKLEAAHIWSTGSDIRIKTRPKAPVAVDGSLFCETPIRIGVAREALRVMVPSTNALSA